MTTLAAASGMRRPISSMAKKCGLFATPWVARGFRALDALAAVAFSTWSVTGSSASNAEALIGGAGERGEDFRASSGSCAGGAPSASVQHYLQRSRGGSFIGGPTFVSSKKSWLRRAPCCAICAVATSGSCVSAEESALGATGVQPAASELSLLAAIYLHLRR